MKLHALILLMWVCGPLSGQLPEGYTISREFGPYGPLVIEKDGKFGIYDQTEGRLLVDAVYDEIGPMDEVAPGLCKVRKGDLHGMVWDYSEILLHPVYEEIVRVLVDGPTLLRVKLAGRYGLMSVDFQKMVLKAEYDEIELAESDLKGYIKIKKNGLLGGYHIEEGFAMIPPKYTRLETNFIYDDPVVYAWKGAKVGVLYSWGKTKIPLSYESVLWNEEAEVFECRKGKTTDRFTIDGVKK